MDDPVHIIQVQQAPQDRLGDFAYNLNRDSAVPPVYIVQRSRIHALHDDADVHIGGEAAIVADDVGRVAVVHDLQLAHNLFSYRWFGIDQDELHVSVVEPADNGIAQHITW